MSVSLSIPLTRGAYILLLQANRNKLFVLGANGTGKSALFLHLYRQHNQIAHKVSAYRETSLTSGAPGMTGQQYQQATNALRKWDANPQSRYLESQSGYSRPSRTISALMQKQRARDRRATRFLDKRKPTAATKYTEGNPDPIDIVNELFRTAHISVQIEIDPDDSETIIARRRGARQSYTIEKLSDGERSALLLAAEIITAPEGTLFLIDEPERHLHRSIISPLLSALFGLRPDCYFVISTHEVLLPQDCGSSTVLVLRGCEFDDDGLPKRWDADHISSDIGIDDDLKADIWGARRKMLYVEGKPSGSDERLYSAIFPEVTVRAKGSSSEVISAVQTVRSMESLHWLNVFGLIDRDSRTSEGIGHLAEDYIFTLPVRAVESIYYRDIIRDTLCERQAEHLGLSSEDMKVRARQMVLQRTGTLKKLLTEENESLKKLVERQDAEGIIREFPIRRSAIPNEVAKSLGYSDKQQYEQAVCARIRNNIEAQEEVAGLLGDIVEALHARDDS